MSHAIRNRIKQQIDRFKKSFLQTQDLPFEDFFPAASIADIIANTPHKRSSVFSPLVTLKAFIFQALSDDGCCKKAVASVMSDRIGNDKPANSYNTEITGSQKKTIGDRPRLICVKLKRKPGSGLTFDTSRPRIIGCYVKSVQSSNF